MEGYEAPDVRDGTLGYEFSVPPGEEGELLSNAGGDYALSQDVLAEINEYVSTIFSSSKANSHYRIRYDSRTRNDRTHLQNQAWAAQLTNLACAYMNFKQRAIVERREVEGTVPMEIFCISMHGESLSPPPLPSH
jgi:hypothetical protein